MTEGMTSVLEDEQEARDIAEFEAAMGPVVHMLSPEMYNFRFALFAAAKDEATARRKEMKGKLDASEEG